MMNNKVKEKTELRQAASGCLHHWLIESARGATSRGTCKYCGEERLFYNSWTDFSVMKRSVSSSVIDELFADPVPTEGRGEVRKMKEAWLSWGRDKGYIKGSV